MSEHDIVLNSMWIVILVITVGLAIKKSLSTSESEPRSEYETF